MQQIAEFSQINGLVITPHTEGKQNIKLFLNNGKVLFIKKRKSISLFSMNKQLLDLVFVICRIINVELAKRFQITITKTYA